VEAVLGVHLARLLAVLATFSQLNGLSVEPKMD